MIRHELTDVRHNPGFVRYRGTDVSKQHKKPVEIVWINVTINYSTSAFGPKSEDRHSVSVTSLNVCTREIIKTVQVIQNS